MKLFFAITEGEGFSLAYELDWDLAELLIKRGVAQLPEIELTPYKF